MANPPAIELVPGVFRIPTVGSWQINSYAFVDDDGSVTLVDTGLRSAPPKLVTGLAAMGLRVVATPGHSPGHISLLQERSRVLVTGDAIFNVLGVRLSPRPLCSDYRMTQRTAQRLGELEYDVAAFTHGPEITENPREALRGYLRKTVGRATPD